VTLAGRELVREIDGHRPPAEKHPNSTFSLGHRQKVFLTIDNFESSLLPLTVPKSLAVDIPSSAAPKNYMQRKPWGSGAGVCQLWVLLLDSLRDAELQ
jgi:hypothetical protein